MSRREERTLRTPHGVHCIRTLREPMRLPVVIISPPCQHEADARAYCDEREDRLPALRALRQATEAEHRSELAGSGLAA